MAYKNYEYFKDKGVFKEYGIFDLDQNITISEFQELYQKVTNRDPIEFESEPKELMTRADVARLLAVNLELDELFEISAEDYIDGEGLDESLKK